MEEELDEEWGNLDVPESPRMEMKKKLEKQWRNEDMLESAGIKNKEDQQASTTLCTCSE